MKVNYEGEKTMHGVVGQLTQLGKNDQLWMHQRFMARRRVTDSDFEHESEGAADIKVEVRFDDECGNGHNTFAITGSMKSAKYDSFNSPGSMGGCIHEKIAQHFPELAHLIKWHLVDSTGPMHYVANTLYHASNRDHWGHVKGEPTRFEYGYRFGDSPVTVRIKSSLFEWIEARRSRDGTFGVVSVEHEKDLHGYNFGPKFTLTFSGEQFGKKWHECPFDDEAYAWEIAHALNVCKTIEPIKTPVAFSEGKERNLDHARSSAVWPEATDEQLCLPKDELKALLEARLPKLLADFRAAITGAGLAWSPEKVTA